MDSGLYAAYTGLMARTQALDTAANNVANAGTNGFRAQRDYFRSALVDGLSPNSLGESQVGNTVNDFGILGGNHLDLGQGQLQTTGNPLDLAIQGSGFFAIKTAQSIQYTRDGAFTRSSTGVLQTNLGEPVLDKSQQPITIPTGSIHIAPDGTVSVSTADGSAAVGQIGVFTFSDSSTLSAEGTNRFSANGAKPAIADGAIQQGALEGANEDAIHGTMQLILVQRQAEMMQKALSVFNNDFDKTAAEELPRV
ncbi:flagellar hook-basal body protein [Edaphobacter bradus]|uniref:flagellar hook-basal body protein n=1 Tax=Edaphobacter bradus TaxID=2259016 RepID=UPI0021DFA3D9|nr:flagellar hook basal-body protein [Edaphobacter bradus]